MTSTATFDPAVVAETVARTVRERLVEVREQAETEAMRAMASVEAYAKHLAGGGDPREGYEGDAKYGGPKFVASTPYLKAVYRRWNEARGGRNPFSAIDDRQRFEIAEYGLARLGEPVPFSTYRNEVVSAGRRRASSTQSDDVARALAACQGADLVLRRTKIDGKIAYLLRERKEEGEEPVGQFFTSENDDRVHVSLFATNIPHERWNPEP